MFMELMYRHDHDMRKTQRCNFKLVTRQYVMGLQIYECWILSVWMVKALLMFVAAESNNQFGHKLPQYHKIHLHYDGTYRHSFG